MTGDDLSVPMLTYPAGPSTIHQLGRSRFMIHYRFTLNVSQINSLRVTRLDIFWSIFIVATAVRNLCSNKCAYLVSNVLSVRANKMDVNVGAINNTRMIEIHTNTHLVTSCVWRKCIQEEKSVTLEVSAQELIFNLFVCLFVCFLLTSLLYLTKFKSIE